MISNPLSGWPASLKKAANHGDAGRLARPVGSEKAENFPLLDVEGDAVDGDQITEFLAQGFDFENRGHGYPVCFALLGRVRGIKTEADRILSRNRDK